jgi:gluconate 5-dehydrogenase
MYKSLFSLVDKTAVITGGAGHLGREMTKGLAAFGARVTVLGRTPASFASLASDSIEGLDGTINCRVCDVTDPVAFASVIDEIYQRDSRLDILINNAAGSARCALENLDKPAWLAGLEGSLNHYFTCSIAVARYMLPAGRGVIINNASIWSIAAPDKRIYLDLKNEPPLFVSAAKGAIVQMTRHLATFWAEHNIRVNAISPGWFPKRRGPDRPDYMQEITSRIPMKRIGAPHELVGLVVYLASDASSYVTGQNIVVDGGYTLW